MSLTNFAGQTNNFGYLTPAQKKVWTTDVWTAARDMLFWEKFMGKGQNSICQKITEMTKTDKGDQCIFYLAADLEGDGVTGDNEREGNEEEQKVYGQIVTLDQWAFQVGNKGKMAEQRSAVAARKLAKDQLTYAIANRIDQAHFLAASGIDFMYNTDGSLRDSRSNMKNLAFNADVRPPSSKRAMMWNGSALVPSVTGSITSAFVPSYKMLTAMTAYAQSHHIKGVMAEGKPYWVVLMNPWAHMQLKNDQDYIKAITTAYPRSADNPFFSGATVTIDGLVIHTHNFVFNTLGAASGSKWGSGGTVNGSRTLLLGAQALASASIGDGSWDEKTFNYGNRWGISCDRIIGIQKPEFYSIYDKTVEDFGILAVDHYIPAS